MLTNILNNSVKNGKWLFVTALSVAAAWGLLALMAMVLPHTWVAWLYSFGGGLFPALVAGVLGSVGSVVVSSGVSAVAPVVTPPAPPSDSTKSV